jgi:hypothetical protein
MPFVSSFFFGQLDIGWIKRKFTSRYNAGFVTVKIEE